LQAAIGTRRFLLIVDNVCRTEDAQAFLLGGPQYRHLLTTSLPQVALAFAEQEAIRVTELEEAEGLVLLAHFVPELVQQDPEGARALVQKEAMLAYAINGLDFWQRYAQPNQFGVQKGDKDTWTQAKEVWTDMRPLSLRKRMEELAKQQQASS